MGITILPKKYYDILDTQTALLASIASKVGDGGIAIESVKDIQRLTRMGLADKLFTEGDQFITTLDGSTPVVVDIIGVGHDSPVAPQFKNSITCQFHDRLFTAQFDQGEAFYFAETELPAGTYHYGTETIRQFTLLSAVPENGHIVINEEQNKATVHSDAYTYDSLEVADIIEGSGGTELTETNSIDRRYGSNNYVTSAVRQYLNSGDTTFDWKPQHIYDRKPTDASYAGPAILARLDPELVEVMGAVKKQVTRNNVYEVEGTTGGQDLFEDRVFLLSQVEVALGSEGTTTGEKVYDYYKNAKNADRIKRLVGGSAGGHWWLRSPNVSYSNCARGVYSNGSLGYYHARSSCGLAPAFCIV